MNCWCGKTLYFRCRLIDLWRTRRTQMVTRRRTPTMARATASRLPVGAKAIAFPNGSVLGAISVRGPSARKALARRKGLGKWQFPDGVFGPPLEGGSEPDRLP